jgi:glucose/arabinose dehydrogenase
MHHSIQVSSSSICIILITFLLFTSILIIDRFLYFAQDDHSQIDHSHIAKALGSKYPEVGRPSTEGPAILDPNLKAELVFRGLRYPTSMAFSGPNDILVTEKDAGTVRRIVNGTELKPALLSINVSTFAHRGLLGIAIAPITKAVRPNYGNSNGHDGNDNTTTAYVFLYYTQAQKHTGDDLTEGKQPLGNRLYRYELSSNKLVNPKLLLNLPATPGAIGVGGKVIVGPDNNVYLTIGDVGINGHNTKAQNIQEGNEPDGTSGILRVNQDGRPALPGVLGNTFPLNIYYSYGIWNSFGLAFDPLTGKLWDTENGLVFGDEINLVNPGFNSGYNKIDGIWLRGYSIDQTEKHVAPLHPNDLVDFGGKGKYHPPQFTWFQSVAPTGITFFNSTRMGNMYENDMFVADAINGNIYHFKLNPQRTGLMLPKGPLSNGVASSSDSLDQIIFGKGFGAITDLKVSAYDGYLYALTFDETQGTIYRIAPVNK